MSESELEGSGAPCASTPQMAPLGFEKNYPKNIFIPILQYLNDLGLRPHYEHCVGTRELFEGKNVVSLAVLHHLLTQPWFLRAVDRPSLIAAVCNKILINSKIKKKLFHLKVAELVIDCDYDNQRDFRHHVSRSVAQLSAARAEKDEFFQFPNLTIYLFHLLASLLDQYVTPCLGSSVPAKTENRQEEDERSEDSHPNRVHVSSKQQLRFYLKLIVRVFNDQRFDGALFKLVLEKLQCLIAQREQEFQEKYLLPEGMLQWCVFIPEVVEKCVAFKCRKIKLTSITLGEWIDNFKAACLRSNNQKKPDQIKMMAEEHTDHEEKTPIASEVFAHTSRAFQPIILQLPSHNIFSS